jgi:hypothetical protein
MTESCFCPGESFVIEETLIVGLSPASKTQAVDAMMVIRCRTIVILPKRDLAKPLSDPDSIALER